MSTFNPWGLEGIARIIKRHKPDVVGLQEINIYGYPTGPVDQPQWLAERLGMHAAFGPTRQFPEQVMRDQPGYTGNALLSRFPIQNFFTQELPKLADTPHRQTLLGATVQTPDGPIAIVITHWAVDLVPHSAQAQATVQFAHSWQPDLPIILLGDFNALPDSPALATIRETFADAYERTHTPVDQLVSYPSGPKGSTTPDGWAGVVDYIFVGPEFTVEKIEVIYNESQRSDHNPVVAQIRLEPAQ